MVLHVLVKILTVPTLVLTDSWRQLLTDGTSRRWSAKQNLIIAISNEVGCEVILILFSTNIIPENEKTETVCQSLLDELEKFGFLLNNGLKLTTRCMESILLSHMLSNYASPS